MKVAFVECGVTISLKSQEPIPNHLQGSSSGGGSSSHVRAFNSAESEPLNITVEILSPERKEGYFNESEEVITVLTKITSLSKEGAKNLEIYAIPLIGLKIENCTYPLRTTKIIDLLNYRASDKSVIEDKDITSIKSIRERLNNTDRDPLYSHIRSLLNNEAKILLARNDSKEDAKLSKEILNDFNIIINRATDQDLNVSHFMGSKVIPRRNIWLNNCNKSLYQGFNNNSNSFLMMNDYRLFKRRILEDAFPDSINRIIYYKEHEDYKLDNQNIISVKKNEIGDAPLKSGESIIFKYYLHPESLGMSGIRYIIRADDFYYEEIKPINIIEREPRFDVYYICPSKELVVNEPMEFEYNIKYIGGDDNEKLFNISINPVINKAAEKAFCMVDPKRINETLCIGKTENFIVNVTYLQEGYRLSPPTITIEGKEEKFEQDIYVYKEDDQPARLHYEKLTLDYQFWLTIMSIFTLIVLIIEIALVSYDLHEARKEKK